MRKCHRLLLLQAWLLKTSEQCNLQGVCVSVCVCAHALSSVTDCSTNPIICWHQQNTASAVLRDLLPVPKERALAEIQKLKSRSALSRWRQVGRVPRTVEKTHSLSVQEEDGDVQCNLGNSSQLTYSANDYWWVREGWYPNIRIGLGLVSAAGRSETAQPLQLICSQPSPITSGPKPSRFWA